MMGMLKAKPKFIVLYERIRELLDLSGKIQELIGIAEKSREDAEAQRMTALRILEQEEAEAAIAGNPGETKSRKQLTAASVALEAVDARVRGLNAKLDETVTTMTKTRAELESERTNWNRQRVADLMPEYLKAVAAFAAVNRKMCALGEALKDKTIIDAAQSAAAFSPLTGEFILEDAVATGHERGWVYQCWDPDWENDDKARALYEEHRHAGEITLRVDEEIARLEERRRRRIATANRPAASASATTELSRLVASYTPSA